MGSVVSTLSTLVQQHTVLFVTYVSHKQIQSQFHQNLQDVRQNVPVKLRVETALAVAKQQTEAKVTLDVEEVVVVGDPRH